MANETTNDVRVATTDAGAVVGAALRLAAIDLVELPGGNHAIVLPEGKSIKTIKPLIDEYAARPDRIKGTAQLTTVASFIEHANRFKDADSAVFADVANQKAPKLIAVLDYHEALTPTKVLNDRARFGQHRGEYAFPVSDEWMAWTKPREPMNQEAFAEFLEERILDVLEPNSLGRGVVDLSARLGIIFATPQRVMELSRGLTVRVGQQVSNHQNLSSGEAQIGFTESHQDGAGGPLMIPGGFAIGIPVFKGSDAFTMAVRLRYRVKGGAVLWTFAVQQADKVWDTCVTEACDKVKEETKLPLYMGKPEA